MNKDSLSSYIYVHMNRYFTTNLMYLGKDWSPLPEISITGTNECGKRIAGENKAEDMGFLQLSS